jgi:hypothetical protein
MQKKKNPWSGSAAICEWWYGLAIVYATHGIYEIPVKVLFSNSVEYTANNYDQFSYRVVLIGQAAWSGKDAGWSFSFKTFEREA